MYITLSLRQEEATIRHTTPRQPSVTQLQGNHPSQDSKRFDRQLVDQNVTGFQIVIVVLPVAYARHYSFTAYQAFQRIP